MSLPNRKEKEKKGFDVEQLPVGTRRTIRWAVLSLIMAVILLVWVPIVKHSISQNSAQGSGELEGVGRDLETFLDQVKTKMAETQENLTPSGPKPEPESEAEKEAAQLLAEQLTAGWQEYDDFENRFSLKYPASLLLSTSSEVLARLGPTSSTTVLEVKKFASYGSFSNLQNIRKIHERPGYFLVIIDYANDTTTDLINKTFKLLDNNL